MDCCWILLFGLTLQSVLAIIEPDASKVQETDAPYIVYIQGQIYCGGSLITDEYIFKRNCFIHSFSYTFIGI